MLDRDVEDAILEWADQFVYGFRNRALDNKILTIAHKIRKKREAEELEKP
jgi:hypothetical protein